MTFGLSYREVQEIGIPQFDHVQLLESTTYRSAAPLRPVRLLSVKGKFSNLFMCITKQNTSA